MSERGEFEAWWDRHGQFVRAGGGDYEKCFAYAAWNFRATPQQAVPALTEPVAWHIGNADGSINKIGAVYIRRSLAEKHIASYEGELDAQIVPLYATAQPVAVPALTAKQRYDAFMEPGEEPSPIERLRFFCSLAMSGQDWLDVEPFFDDLLAAPQPSPEALTECAEIDPEAWKSLKAHAHDWRFSLQDHVYKCDCGATRGDYPFGAASFKD